MHEPSTSVDNEINRPFIVHLGKAEDILHDLLTAGLGYVADQEQRPGLGTSGGSKV